MTTGRDIVKTRRLLWVLVPAAALLLAVTIWRASRRGESRGPDMTPGIAVEPAPVVIAPRPPATAPSLPVGPLRTQSSLVLPIEIRLSDLKPLVEAGVPRKFDQTLELGAHGPAKDVRATLDLVRGDVTLTPRGDRLAFSFPLTGRIPMKARIDPGFGDGFAARESIDNVRGVVSGWIRLGVDAKWNLTHESDAAMRVEKADVRFPLGITLGVRGPLEEQTKAALSNVLSDALESAAVKLRLRDRAGEVWSTLHASYAVQDAPKVTVSFQPLAARVRPLRFDEDGVARLTLGLSGQATTYVDADAPRPERTALPDLAMSPNPDNTFHLVLPVSVRASDLAASKPRPSESTTGVTFTRRGGVLSLGNPSAYLKVDFDAARRDPAAAATGTVYVAGTLAYDPRDGVLRLTHAAYDAETRAALAGAAGWLLEPAVEQSVAAPIGFSLDAALDGAENAAREQLLRIQPPAGVDLGLTVTHVKLRDIRPAGAWVHLLFDVKGTSHAAVPSPLRR